MIEHEFRAAITSLFIETEHVDESSILRTGYVEKDRLARYDSLQVSDWFTQQVNIFRLLSDTCKTYINLCIPATKKIELNTSTANAISTLLHDGCERKSPSIGNINAFAVQAAIKQNRRQPNAHAENI